MNILAVIPARFESTRFPGKPLVMIAGKSMIQRVYEQALLAKLINQVVVATDDKRIADHVQRFGGNVIMTSADHRSGTDRCAEAASHYADADIIVNIQGDEPFIQPDSIDLLASSFDLPDVQISTLVKRITDQEDLFNPNIPKVTVDSTGRALYFSRQTIPFIRDIETEKWFETHTFRKHIGIYGFRKEILKQITVLPISPLERAEALEQLRWIENGYSIQTMETSYQSHGIDHPDDIERVLKLFKEQL